MAPWIAAMISVGLVSLISLVGVISLYLGQQRVQRFLPLLVSFAVGGLFGDALIHLLPESFEQLESTLFASLMVVTGILIFFILEKFIRWRHCHIPPSDSHHHPVATMNLIGDSIHNFIDGMLIAASYAVSIPIGMTATLAVLLHEIPQELGDFAVLLHGGFGWKKALLFNFLTALAAVAGAGLALAIGPRWEGFAAVMLPVTAGGFIYIAGSDLIPELHHDLNLKNSVGQLISIIMGVGIMVLLAVME